ncbi:MFS transporter [Bacillus xiapuensis]|uniref:MFS transporter n=1 Tax=Bacillus xiapuensis TaxID=2014075 RepID=A0ABU6NBI0_9BACI|nr:MFS transporter [Bacillus xiapuensis]
MNKLKQYINQFHPIVWVLLVGTILSRGSSFMTLPFLSIYLSRHMDLSPVIIGITVGMSPLMGAIGGFIGGNLSDRFGRKKVMLVSLFAISIVYYGFTIGKSQGWFILLNALNGLCNSFFEPTSQALMGDLTGKKNRMKAYSLRYTAINIGASVGPLLGAYLAITSAKLSFALTGSVYLLYAFILLFLMGKLDVGKAEQSNKKSVTMIDAFRIMKTDKALLFLVLGIILISLGYSQMNSNLPQFMQMTLPNGVFIFSVLLTINALLVVILQMPLSHIAEKWTPMQSMVVGALLMAAGLFCFGFINGWATAILSIVFLTLGEIFIFPSNSMLIDQLAPEHLRGTYFGAGQFSKIGNFLGPIIGGYLLSHFQGPIMFWVISLIVFASILFFKLGNGIYVKTRVASGEKGI